MNIRNAILITLFLLVPLVIRANVVKAEEVKLYDLKVKLRPKITESKVYWQGRKEVDWEEERKNRRFGPSSSNLPLVKIDDNIFFLNDFENWQGFNIFEGEVLSKKIELAKGNHHKYERLENSFFDVEWVILEPVSSNQYLVSRIEPEITFKKINPTKYLVKVEGAKGPFWLVFSESFHKQWRVYKSPVTSHQSPEFKEIVADYPKLRIKEARHLMKFTPEDIKFLFEKPLEAEHKVYFIWDCLSQGQPF